MNLKDLLQSHDMADRFYDAEPEEIIDELAIEVAELKDRIEDLELDLEFADE